MPIKIVSIVWLPIVVLEIRLPDENWKLHFYFLGFTGFVRSCDLGNRIHILR